MGRKIVVIVLCAFVTFGIWVGVKTSKLFILPTENSHMWITKNIFIMNTSQTSQISCFDSYLPPKFFIHKESSGQWGFRDIIINYSSSRWNRMIRVSDKIRNNLINFTISNNFITIWDTGKKGRSFPTISNNNFNIIRVILGFVIRRPSYPFCIRIFHSNFYEKIGPFNGGESIGAFFSSISGPLSNSNGPFQIHSLFLGNLPQFTGGLPQSPGESCDDKSSGGSNKSTMDLNPSTKKEGRAFKDEEEMSYCLQGAFLILLAIFLVWYVWKNRLT